VTTAQHHALAALDRAVYLLDRALAPSPKVRAFLRAHDIVAALDPAELEVRVRNATLTELEGIGPSTAQVVTDGALDQPSPYLDKLEAQSHIELSEEGREYRAALRGDCHLHSRWSDGGASIEAMARAAAALGHEYVVLTDHSARLTVAHGLDRDRLLSQLDEVAEVNERVAPFRVLTGMEVDIFEDGSLDLDDEMLSRLDVVVASVHSKFRLPRDQMTRRLVLALANPHTDILGHLTNRKVTHGARPGSDFDAELVFAAAARFEKAIEINCRPERQDPPEELLRLAVEWGCKVAIDTDAHAPGQLEWQAYGCDKAARCRVPVPSIVNTWAADDLVAWAGSHPS
jgi:putative hydrolase